MRGTVKMCMAIGSCIASIGVSDQLYNPWLWLVLLIVSIYLVVDAIMTIGREAIHSEKVVPIELIELLEKEPYDQEKETKFP